MTTTDSPTRTRARLKTAPVPVMTPQPRRAATGIGIVSSMRTTWFAPTTVRSTNTEVFAD